VGGPGDSARADGGLSRRTLLARAGVAGAAAAFAQLPGFLARQGWLEQALATEADVARDTFNGLVAFVVPGPDEYSKAQGQSSRTPGGIAARGTDGTIELLDGFMGTPAGPSLPSSKLVAGLLNGYALQVNSSASSGVFLSPFARLKFAEKIEVFRRFEAGTEGSELRFVSGTLISAVAFMCYGEWGAYDFEARRLTGTPVGWKTMHYAGVTEGFDELAGYFEGRRRVRTARRYRRKRRHADA
jgi:hypothetical protein